MDLFVPAVLVAILWFAAAARLGSRWVDGIEALYLGLGITALLSLVWYSAWGVNGTAAFTLLIVVALAGTGRTPRGLLPPGIEWTPPARLLAVFLVTIIVLGFSFVSTPSVFIDNLHYHTGLPWQYSVEGRLVRQNFDLIGGYPQINEMLLVDILVFAREPRVARIFNMLLLLPFCAALIGRQWAQRGRALECGLLAWVMTAATPLVLQDAVLGKNDILAMIFVYYAATRLERFLREGGTRNVMLSGVHVGLALGTKYTSLLFLPGFVACLLIFRRRAAVPYRSLPALAAFGAACGLTFSPWIIRNGLVYGSPLYPFFFSRETAFSVATGTGILPLVEPSLTALLTTFPSILVIGHGIKPITNVLGFHYLVGVIAAIGVVLWNRGVPPREAPSAFRGDARSPRTLFFDALLYLPGIAVWSLSNPQGRYLLPVWLAMNVRIAELTALLEGVRRKSLLAILCVLMAGNLGYEAYEEQLIFHRFDVILGRVTPDQYLHRFTPVPAIVNTIPQSHRSDTILLVGETQRVYFRNPLIVTGSEDPHPLAAILSDSTAGHEISRRLKNLGARYVYVDFEWWGILRSGVGYLDLSADEEATFREFLAAECTLVAKDEAGRSGLFRLK
jgi:hypothetical protein